jgi:hypothetical protein
VTAITVPRDSAVSLQIVSPPNAEKAIVEQSPEDAAHQELLSRLGFLQGSAAVQ